MLTVLTESPSATAWRASLRWVLLCVLLLAGCRADQATKTWARGAFQDRPMTVVPQVLEFRYAENRAIAFSMFHQMPDKARVPLIFGLTSLALAALLSLIWSMRKQGAARLFPLALILAGALGNLQDRLIHGYVVDFVHVHWRETWSFPIFNLADSLITVGTTLLLIEFLFRPETKASA
jgi:signal peptidase II